MTKCGRCVAEWTGLSMAHCTVCHETFTTVSNFDRHRAGTKTEPKRMAGECHDPGLCGLVRTARGWWSLPGRDDAP